MNKLFPVFQFVRYWLHKVNEHSLQSPFLYQLYTDTIKPDNEDEFARLTELRQTLLSNHELLRVEDLGAGSRISNASQRKVSSIARHASTPPRFSRLLSRLVSRFDCEEVLELGTSLGLNTLHLCHGNPQAKIHTVEGSSTIAAKATEHFQALGAKNIHLTVGNIDEVLEEVLADMTKIDLAYMDANHRYEPTLRYYEQILPKLHRGSLVIVDDIHWSRGMNAAWKELCDRPEVTLSLDLFEGGILFFDPALRKEQYTLAF